MRKRIGFQNKLDRVSKVRSEAPLWVRTFWLIREDKVLETGNTDQSGIDQEMVQGNDDTASTAGSTKAQNSLWVTVLVGLAMLLIGVLVGFFGRSLVTPQPESETSVAAADTGNSSAASEASQAVSTPSAAALMDAVVAQTRHFKGDLTAPITIIEFGDFK